jgi:drug/metabolite transporter (DMT)-like permease
VVLSTALWGASAVANKIVLHRLSPHFIIFYQISISVPFFFLCGLLWDQPMITALNGEVVIALLYQALVAAAFGFIAWNTLLQYHGAVILNSFISSCPSRSFPAWWPLSEPLTAKILLLSFHHGTNGRPHLDPKTMGYLFSARDQSHSSLPLPRGGKEKLKLH